MNGGHSARESRLKWKAWVVFLGLASLFLIFLSFQKGPPDSSRQSSDAKSNPIKASDKSSSSPKDAWIYNLIVNTECLDGYAAVVTQDTIVSGLPDTIFDVLKSSKDPHAMDRKLQAYSRMDRVEIIPKDTLVRITSGRYKSGIVLCAVHPMIDVDHGYILYHLATSDITRDKGTWSTKTTWILPGFIHTLGKAYDRGAIVKLYKSARMAKFLGTDEALRESRQDLSLGPDERHPLPGEQFLVVGPKVYEGGFWYEIQEYSGSEFPCDVVDTSNCATWYVAEHFVEPADGRDNHSNSSNALAKGANSPR